MTIILNFPKYDNFQYDNNFKKIVILQNWKYDKKKTMAGKRGRYLISKKYPISKYPTFYPPDLVPQVPQVPMNPNSQDKFLSPIPIPQVPQLPQAPHMNPNSHEKFLSPIPIPIHPPGTQGTPGTPGTPDESQLSRQVPIPREPRSIKLSRQVPISNPLTRFSRYIRYPR